MTDEEVGRTNKWSTKRLDEQQTADKEVGRTNELPMKRLDEQRTADEEVGRMNEQRDREGSVGVSYLQRPTKDR